MQVFTNASLKPYHTFSIDISCDVLVIIESVEDLIQVYQDAAWEDLPKLMIGKGSNLLFTEHYSGVVIVNRIMGKRVSEEADAWNIHVNAGEDWPSIVEWSIEQGYAGLENLALIPGCAGSAPIQNIGAYGKEFKDFCQYVDVLTLDTFESKRLTPEQCRFGYRDSVFKHELYKKVVITGVGLSLDKDWVPCINYGSLQTIPSDELSPKRIYQEICRVRMAKLPDPEEQGNAGSFFKNPLISKAHFDKLKTDFPDIVGYDSGEQVKVAAGWLIDHCDLKGFQVGGAMVHPNQALVLVNVNHASAKDIVQLAATVREKVRVQYQVELEHEVRFMGSTTETYLSELVG
ncbi:UDP-N-acetylenolpyruvoylglucosamine reductase [Vibrio albus]|jgi:UDP-N-acetylmuramate dehydrogenase|uniref:UDP-N-acetylenolpyruvoylglucosamine reductase n=1 Tax=Vibrio albus TaxID=2200953 RepID=A0A2U3BAL7_9VIBR|nr:UDP-N-acetylmuramate dehydrogenase [Vibrio albus]PWI33774.1 UDP-N-acetylenolpyruvoylglucosamine reductase [Vibrio albus]